MSSSPARSIARPGPDSLVSVIVPCYRQAEYLSEAIESLRAQSHANWECIIVNDGSPDDTRSVATRLAATDGRIRYVEQENRGCGAARNRALELSSGQFIQLLDADDLLLPGKLTSSLAEAGQAQRPSVVVSDFWLMDEAGKRFESVICTPEFVFEDPLHDLSLRWETELSIATNALFFDSRLFADPPLRFDPGLPNHEDWDCWMRLFARRPEVRRIREKLSIYRVHRDSLSRDEAKNWLGFRDAIDRQFCHHADDATVRRMLTYKRKLTDDFYGKGWRAGAVGMLRRRGKLSRTLPAPVRDWLLERFDLSDLRAHGWKH